MELLFCASSFSLLCILPDYFDFLMIVLANVFAGKTGDSFVNASLPMFGRADLTFRHPKNFSGLTLFRRKIIVLGDGFFNK